MRWILIVLLMCNGIYFLWQNYLLQAEQPVAIDNPAPNAGLPDTLVLLEENSERPVEPQRALATVEQSRNQTTGQPELLTPDRPGVCWQIGPFAEEVSGKQVASRLAALDISLQLQSLEIPGNPDYWVHIPPQVSRKAAIKLLRELQAKKIDSFLITEGSMENGISLGIFTQQPRAEKLYEQRKDQGYEVEIKVIPRSHTEIWAVFDTVKYGELSDILWEKINQGNKDLERHKNYCDKIASTDNFD